ncbi:MAG TPA: hypothetical protein VJU81_23100 [Methylomirabilota bacterium]|nr:hypothetical protein [Methylomirabilota bacterium]
MTARDAIERALAEGSSGDPHVTLLKSWTRNDVWRVRPPEPARAAGSVIVKRWKAQPARGLDEWAALDLLTEARPDVVVAPRFLGGDLAARCFVMEDLGRAPTLEDVLNASGAGAPEGAADALIDVARLTARLHVAARALAAQFDARRDALAARPRPTASEAAHWLRRRRADLETWLGSVGERLPDPVDEALKALADFVEEPGAWTTVTHGDMAPSNTLRAGDGWRLVDFEYAGVRPALYDALLWTLFCPFPPELIARADAAYRDGLAAGFPVARDARHYAAARARVAAWRMLDLLHWQAPALLDADRPWAPGVGARGAVLWHLARFHALAPMEDAVTAPIAAATRPLERALLARWGAPPDAASVWPAFRVDRL